MTLLEFCSSLSQQDSHLTAYISEDCTWTPLSEIVLALESDDGTVPTLTDRDVNYFLEVNIAKEVVSSWENEVSHSTLNPLSRANLLIYYAQNDAYPSKDFFDTTG